MDAHGKNSDGKIAQGCAKEPGCYKTIKREEKKVGTWEHSKQAKQGQGSVEIEGGVPHAVI